MKFAASLVEMKFTLTLILLTWRIWRTSNNARKWHMGINSAFKGLRFIN